MDKEGRKILLGLDVSTACIGVTLLLDDGSDYGQIIELTHISPKVSSKVKGIEQLFLKKQIFEKFIEKFKGIGIDEAVIEEPLLRSNNINTCGTLLRFNGMISDCIYNVLGIVPEYISSYDARKYSFPELMAIRKYGKDGKQYEFKKILNEITNNKFVLFGSYSWEVDKKTVMQGKVAELFPNIEWVFDKKGELKKENFDASDSYVACLGYLNQQKFGELDFKVTNIEIKHVGEEVCEQSIIEYDVNYWNKTVHRTTYVDHEKSETK